MPTVRAAITGTTYGNLMQNNNGVIIIRKPVLGANLKYSRYTISITIVETNANSIDIPNK
jgi:hypothetical protein